MSKQVRSTKPSVAPELKRYWIAERDAFRGVMEAYQSALSDDEIPVQRVLFYRSLPLAKVNHFVDGQTNKHAFLQLDVFYNAALDTVFPERFRTHPEFELAVGHSSAMYVQWDTFLESTSHFNCQGRLTLFEHANGKRPELVSFGIEGNRVNGRPYTRDGVKSLWPNITRNIVPGADARTAASYLVEKFAELKREHKSKTA